MNANALTPAYRDLLETAQHYDATVPATHATRPEADWRLVHIALSDALIEQALEATENGQSALVDNRPAQDATAIAAVIKTSTAAQRIEQLRRRGHALVARVAGLDPALWTHPVRLLVHDRDLKLVADQQMPWHALIALRASTHLPAHTRKFQAWIDDTGSA